MDGLGGELVHRVVASAGLQGCIACEIVFVVVPEIGAGHLLMVHTGNRLADFPSLDVGGSGRGLQNALWSLGASPLEHRSGSLSAAFTRLGLKGRPNWKPSRFV